MCVTNRRKTSHHFSSTSYTKQNYKNLSSVFHLVADLIPFNYNCFKFCHLDHLIHSNLCLLSHCFKMCARNILSCLSQLIKFRSQNRKKTFRIMIITIFVFFFPLKMNFIKNKVNEKLAFVL